ncbi:hypothetical protein [Mucilaginibacter gynuensis]
MKKTALVLALFCFLLGGSAYAQTTADAAKPQGTVTGATTLIDKFFKAYGKESTNAAVMGLFKTNKLVDSTKLVDLVSKIDAERALLGDYHGKELIVQKKASGSLVLYSYLVKHEKQPVRFTFMFYKPKNEWMIYRLYFDDQVETELQDSAKL